jgi:hypothetical protein
VASDLVATLRRLSDAELVARLKDLVARERDSTAALVAHLAELETRGLHLKSGYASLFAYCRDGLGLAEHEAYNRIEVARASRRFPVILERLAGGASSLTTVRLLAPYLTAENHLQVLEEARGKRKAAVEEIVARLAPWPDAPALIRKLPAARVAVSSSTSLPSSSSFSPALSASTPSVPPLSRALPPGPPAVTPLSPDRYKLQVTIGGPTLEKLRLAQDMLRHAIPSGDEAAVLDRALTALLADLARKKFAATDHPRPASGQAPGSRHVPAEVKRAVWLRDLGRCAFVAEDGRRCAERAFVEFHHVRPWAAGGEATVENIQLRCRRHNHYEARAYFARPAPGEARGVEPVRNESRPPGRGR